MIAPPPILDLDDAASLEAADSPGVLRSAATGGALVRATAAAMNEDMLAPLAGVRPRSLILITGSGRARRAASLLVAALGGSAGLPIIVAATLPPWAGALDVVVVSGDDAGDPRLADATDRAVRRGAEVVVATPDEGPMRVAAAGRAILLPPRIGVLDHNTLLRHLSVAFAVLGAVDAQRSGRYLPDLDALADLLDAEAAADHPRNEVFHNPAKALAARMQRRRVVVAGDTPSTVEVAAHATDVLLGLAGRIAVPAALADVAAAAPELSGGAVVENYDPLFHDEEFDGPSPEEPVRVFVLSTDPDRRSAQRRIAVLADADLVTAGADEQPLAGRVPPSPGDTRPAGQTAELEQLAVLAVRLEMAAAYVRLIAGPAPVEGVG